MKLSFDPVLFSASVGELCEIERQGLVSTAQAATIMRKAIEAQLEAALAATKCGHGTWQVCDGLNICRGCYTILPKDWDMKAVAALAASGPEPTDEAIREWAGAKFTRDDWGRDADAYGSGAIMGAKFARDFHKSQ